MSEPARIILANNRGVALVDPEDFERTNALRWNLKSVQGGRYRYPQHWYRRPDGRDACDVMGRFILDCPPDQNVVYLDGDGLNCQRSNLAVATVAQRTARETRVNKTGYRGVYKRPCGRFAAQIWSGGSITWLGYHQDAPAAARAYDAAAREAFGPHATLNFPDEVAA